MEKQVETPLTFRPYRRSSHLQSETYRTLVRIMSHCYGSHSQVSLDTPRLSPQSPIPVSEDNSGGNSSQPTEIVQWVDPSLEHGGLPASHTVSEDNCGGNSGQATEIGVNECEQLVDPGLEHGSLPASHSQVSRDTPQLAPQSLIQDIGGGISEQTTKNGANECGQLVDPGLEPCSLPASTESCEATGVHDTGFSAKEMDIDEIDKLMGTNAVDEFLNMDMFVDNDNEGTGSQEYDLQEFLMDDLMEIVTGNVEGVHDNDKDDTFASPKNHPNGNDGAVLPINREANLCHQESFMQTSEDAGQLKIDANCRDQKVGEDCKSLAVADLTSETCNSSADADMTMRNCDSSAHTDLTTNNCNSSADADLTTKNCTSSADADMTINNCNSSADADMTVKNCNSLADADMATKKMEASKNYGDKISSLNTNGTELLEVEKSVVANGTGRTDDRNSEDGEAEEGEISGDLGISEYILSASSPETVVSEEMTRDNMEDVNSKKELAFNQQTVDRVKSAEIELSGRRNLVYYGEIVENEAVGDQGIELNAKENVKKKHGILTQVKKIKKKRRERKKRAEKNQQLGVKRLKLQTVLKPKPVTICRHYLKGRCQEGDKCKFSHDAVPLTKSEPCRYFARHLCMKGDECPFDHQLSKYPCTNFADAGFCGRGKGCMFSHKIPLKEGTTSTSNVSKDELKPSSLSGNSNIKVPLKSKVNASSNQMGDLHLRMAEALLKQPASVPKGFSFLSIQNPSMVNSSGMKHGGSSPIPMANRSGEVLNNNNAGVVQNINEIPKRATTVVAPKGINLLSFGESPTSLKDSGVKKPSSSPLNVEDSVKSSVFKFNIFKQGSSTDFMNDCSELGNRTPQSASATTQKSNKISTASQFRMRFPSIGNDLRDESSQNQQYSNYEENKNAFGTFLRSLSASPQTSREGQPKTMQNSAQNVMSTLAFATRFASQRKMINQATASTSVDKEKVDSSGISPIDHSDRASKILKFLSSTPGNVSKQ